MKSLMKWKEKMKIPLMAIVLLILNNYVSELP